MTSIPVVTAWVSGRTAHRSRCAEWTEVCKRWSCASEQLIVPSESNMADWNRGHGSVDSMLDAENKRLADNLASKVSRLKSLAYDIDRDVEDQNDYLDNMDSNFMSATGLLSGSVKRFSTMVRSGKDNRRLLCYVSGGLVLAFFLLYYLVSRIQS